MLIITTSFYFSTLTPLGPGTLSKAVFDILYAQLVGKTERQWWRQEERGERKGRRREYQGEENRKGKKWDKRIRWKVGSEVNRGGKIEEDRRERKERRYVEN